jgi:hypothetical protein
VLSFSLAKDGTNEGRRLVVNLNSVVVVLLIVLLIFAILSFAGAGY